MPQNLINILTRTIVDCYNFFVKFVFELSDGTDATAVFIKFKTRKIASLVQAVHNRIFSVNKKRSHPLISVFFGGILWYRGARFVSCMRVLKDVTNN